MIVWLASYPRSGNTFIRALLHYLFGFETYSVYQENNETQIRDSDTETLLRLVGQTDDFKDMEALRRDTALHFVKTHEPAPEDDFPAIVLVRDGRDALISYAYYILKTERGIEHPSRDILWSTLEEVITGDHFGGWSRNVGSWVGRVGLQNVVRYEQLIQEPVSIVTAALKRLGVTKGHRATVPTFEELHAAVPWFFRAGRPGTWSSEMPAHLQQLFLQRHGDTLARLGYRD